MTAWLWTSLIYIAGCIYMMRGGSPHFPIIAKPFGVIDSESGKPQVPRWATVIMQLVVIVPFLVYSKLPLYTAAIYCIGWYLTIMKGWGKFFDCKTWNHRFKFFLRMCQSIALFLPLALIKQGFYIESAIIAVIFAIAFSLSATFVYFLYNRQTGHTDNSFNWAEFITGALLAAMTFNLLVG